MKVYEKKVVPQSEINICTRMKCDLCGIETPCDTWYSNEWDRNETEVSITIKSEQARYYGNDGDSVTRSIDLCPECFRDKLVPWLISQGANVRQEEVSW